MYVVVGANGFLGGYIIKAVLELTGEKVIATARKLDNICKNERVEWHMCDVQSDESVDAFLSSLKQYEEIKMIYLAAYHHPDEVEQNRELAWDINVTSLSKFLNKASFVDKLFYASTDSVYGNSKDGYHFKENDALSPVNFYGHNKCAAESLMVHLGRNVVRFPFLISPSIVYKQHFYDDIVNNLRNGKPFEMFDDSYRSSLSFENAGKLLICLMEKNNIPQIINVCGDDDLSKYDVGLLIAEREGLDKNLIIPVSISKQQKNFVTKRAESTLMSNELLKSILGLKRISIFDAFK